MLINMLNIFDWTKSNDLDERFVEGLQVLGAEHIIQFGKIIEKSTAELISIHARCMQSSTLKNAPHTLTGEITVIGKILKFTCSCKAGQGEKCKHVIATLLKIIG